MQNNITLWTAVIAFVGGGVVVWLFKDWIMRQVLGAKKMADKLREKASNIEKAL